MNKINIIYYFKINGKNRIISSNKVRLFFHIFKIIKLVRFVFLNKVKAYIHLVIIEEFFSLKLKIIFNERNNVNTSIGKIDGGSKYGNANVYPVAKINISAGKRRPSFTVIIESSNRSISS